MRILQFILNAGDLLYRAFGYFASALDSPMMPDWLADYGDWAVRTLQRVNPNFLDPVLTLTGCSSWHEITFLHCLCGSIMMVLCLRLIIFLWDLLPMA